MVSGVKNCSSYINNFTFVQNFDETHNPLTFITTLCNSRKLSLLDAVLSNSITKSGILDAVNFQRRMGQMSGYEFIKFNLDSNVWYT